MNAKQVKKAIFFIFIIGRVRLIHSVNQSETNKLDRDYEEILNTRIFEYPH